MNGLASTTRLENGKRATTAVNLGLEFAEKSHLQTDRDINVNRSMRTFLVPGRPSLIFCPVGTSVPWTAENVSLVASRRVSATKNWVNYSCVEEINGIIAAQCTGKSAGTMN